jgi:PAS domain S-box-containing protein
MEIAEAIHVQPNSGTTMGPAAVCRFSGCIMPAMASSEQGSGRVNAQLLVDLIPALIHTARPDGYLDYFNKPWLEYLGVTLDEVTGWNWTAFVHPEDVEGIAAKWRACLATGEIFEYETRVRRADGQYRWMLHHKLALRDEQGNIVKWYGSSIDIEERKRAEEALKRSETYLAEAHRLTHTGSFAYNPGTRKTVYWSEELFRIFGLDPQRGIPAFDETAGLVHPDDLARVSESCLRGFREKAQFSQDYRLLLHDGSVKHLHAIWHPVLDKAGEVVEYVGTAADVTERKRAEEALCRSEAYLTEAQRLSHTGSFGWRPTTGEIVWSDETYRIFEYGPAEKPTVNMVLQRTHPQDRALVQQLIEDASKSGTDFELEHRLVAPSGAIKYVRVRAHALHDSSGNIEFVGAVTDITERKTAEESLRNSEAYLAEAQRLSQTGSWAWSPEQDIRYWSEECYRVLSFDPRDGLPRFEEFFQRIHPDDQPAFMELIQTAIHEKAEWEADYRIVHPDVYESCAIRDIHVVGHPVLSTSGHLVEFVGTVIDVTERKRAEEERRRSEMELGQILDFSPQLISVYGPNRERLYANRVMLDYLGFSLEEWRRRSKFGESLHPDDWERATGYFDRAVTSGAGFELESRLRKGDGSYRWFLFRCNPVCDDKGQITRWYVTGADIEDRKQAEQRLQGENVALREEIDKTSMFEEIVGTSPALRAVLARVSKVAPTDSSVLITGETGTGKELIARAIHRRSKRSSRAFVSVNCAAIPHDLIASELFGHEKGAFTGALQRRLGRFELAEGGTIFLDEVGELPPETQIALLRVLQEREFERVGGIQSIQADVRVIAATNRDLPAAITGGAFRSDLFYRLNVFPIETPSLRGRREDVPLLVEYFVARYARKAGKKIRGIDKETMELLQSYPWPGNIRELQNVVERSVILCETETFSVDPSWISAESSQHQAARPPFTKRPSAQEKERIEAVLAETGGRVSGPSGAAAMLGMSASTLESKIRALKINKFRFKTG